MVSPVPTEGRLTPDFVPDSPSPLGVFLIHLVREGNRYSLIWLLLLAVLMTPQSYLSFEGVGYGG